MYRLITITKITLINITYISLNSLQTIGWPEISTLVAYTMKLIVSSIFFLCTVKNFKTFEINAFSIGNLII